MATEKTKSKVVTVSLTTVLSVLSFGNHRATIGTFVFILSDQICMKIKKFCDSVMLNPQIRFPFSY